MMEIQREEHGKRGAFFIDENGEWVAEMTYVKSGDAEITVDHTEVDKKLKGENIGEDLVASAVAYAREKGLKIKSTCSFASKVLEENADYKDVFSA